MSLLSFREGPILSVEERVYVLLGHTMCDLEDGKGKLRSLLYHFILVVAITPCFTT